MLTALLPFSPPCITAFLTASQLLQPHKSYADHFGGLVEDSAARLPSSAGLPRAARWAVAAAAAVLLPKGVAIRSTQV